MGAVKIRRSPRSHAQFDQMSVLYLMVMFVGLTTAQLNIDLSRAQIDPDTGNFCMLQKVCITNPPESLTSSGCAPQYPPGCDCSPDFPDDSACSPGYSCVQCKCLPPGCNCDPESDNPDGFCMAGESCQDCVCRPKYPPGCDCDPYTGDSSVCNAGYQCVQCKCLPPGCDCDPMSDNPDGFCMAGEVCKDCVCSPALPPGCECDPDLPNADAFCPGQTRCVGCKCQDCPASAPTEKVINPPLVFVIDTTKSVKPDKDSIFNLTRKVVETIMQDQINIPRYQLVTFNDFGPAINRNVRLEIDTPDVRAFGDKTANLKFESYNGGRDSKERLTQGLLVALQNSSPKSLIVVFTDNGSKDLALEKEIIRLRESKECEVYIVLTPEYEGKPNGKSLPAYSRMGKVFLISEVGADNFLQTVEEFEEGNCL